MQVFDTFNGLHLSSVATRDSSFKQARVRPH